jgi:hypothetical protein
MVAQQTRTQRPGVLVTTQHGGELKGTQHNVSGGTANSVIITSQAVQQTTIVV